jgi:hypothetical protein
MEEFEAKRLAKQLSDAAFRENFLTQIETDLIDETKFMEAYHFDHELPKGTMFVKVLIPVPENYVKTQDFTNIKIFIDYVCCLISEHYGNHPMFGGRVDSVYLGLEWHQRKKLEQIVLTFWDKKSYNA